MEKEIDLIWGDMEKSLLDTHSPPSHIKGLCCSQPYLVVQDGENVCSNCGIVRGDRVKIESEWNNYRSPQGAVQNKSRVGPSGSGENPFSDPLSTFVPKGFKVTTRRLKEDGTYTDYRIDLSHLHMQQYYTHQQKSFQEVINHLDNMCTDRLPQGIVHEAKEIWKDACQTRIFRGAKRKGLIACCVYYACKHLNIPKEPREIMNIFKIENITFKKGNDAFREIFEDHPKWGYLLRLTTRQYSIFEPKCCEFSQIKKPYVIARKCTQLLTENPNLEKVLDAHFTPKSKIAGVIYWICQKEAIKLKKCEIYRSSLRVCNPTLNSVLRQISRILDENNILPPCNNV